MRAPREWPALEPALFAVGLGVYAAGLSLGLPRASAGAGVARAMALRDFTPGDAPLALLVARLFGYLPLGDLATRANLASTLTGALALALMGRLACQTLRLMRPAEAASDARRGHEVFVAAGAALAIGLSLGVFRASVIPGGAALTLAVAVAAWSCVLGLVREPGHTGYGTRLAVLAGLAAGVDRAALPLIWLPALVFWLRSLRRGQRWPLVAPLLFMASLGVVLMVAALSSSPLSLGHVVERLWPVGAPGIEDFAESLRGGVSKSVRVAGLEAAEQVGVVGLLLAAVGLLMLAVRRPLVGAVVAWALVMGLWMSGEGARLAMVAIVAPLAVGLSHLAAKLGRARAAGVFALAFMTIASTALDGGALRWRTDARLPVRLVTRALDDQPLRASVDPGTPEMAALFRYAIALGVRPDLTITSTK